MEAKIQLFKLFAQNWLFTLCACPGGSWEFLSIYWKWIGIMIFIYITLIYQMASATIKENAHHNHGNVGSTIWVLCSPGAMMTSWMQELQSALAFQPQVEYAMKSPMTRMKNSQIWKHGKAKVCGNNTKMWQNKIWVLSALLQHHG